LLGKNPFPEKPPRYLRANIYRYHFSNLKERERGIWWQREDERVYLPVVSRGRP
jgi:lipase maturation factor 1